MNKFILFAGVIVAGALLYNVHLGNINTNVVFRAMSVPADGLQSSISLTDNHTENSLIDRIAGTDRIYGAVVVPNISFEDDLQNYFQSLSKKQVVGKFIILAEENDAVDFVIPYINEYFPDSLIAPMLIDDEIDTSTLISISNDIVSEANDETFVVASTLFSREMPSRATAFHAELKTNVFESFDIEGIWQMDVDSRGALYVLMNYLKDKGARQIKWDGVIASFIGGEAISLERHLSILAFGDMMLGRYVRTLMDRNGKDYIFKKIAGFENRFFKGADLIFANLEGPIKGHGKSGGTSMNFSFNEDIAPFLKQYGFNLFTLANNHATDQGWAGRDTTIKALDENDLGWCGHPSEADPASVYYNQVGNTKYAFVCLHDVTYKLDDEAALNLIREVRPKVDYLITTIHWGVEYKHSPNENLQITPGRDFIDAGADIVIGHHPHVVQGFEEYNGKLIFYSLGNFVFDQYFSRDTQEELALGIILGENKTKVYLFPMKSEKTQSRLMTEEEYNEWIERFIGYGNYDENLSNMIRSGVIEIVN